MATRRFEHDIECAVEEESARLDDMRPQSIGAYNKCLVEHMENIAELERKLEIEKSLVYLARTRLKMKISDVSLELGFHEDFVERGTEVK